MTFTFRTGFTLALTLFATVIHADAIDNYVASEMKRQQIPGVALAVIQNGKTVKLKTYGVSNLELNTPVKPTTVFKIGSLSKQFIATATLLLADEGKLRIEDTVSQYLDDAPASWNAITVKHLLTHTSGLPRESPGFDPLKAQTNAAMIRAAYGVAFRFQPGEKFEYCNLGYFILAEIVEKVSGTPWPTFVSERIFEPLGMTSSRLADESAIVPERASGYVLLDGNRKHSRPLLAVRPSGAFASSLNDLIKWNSALDARRVLRSSTWEQAWSQSALKDGTQVPYGFGWFVENAGPHHVVQHSGAIYGFTAQYSRFDEQGLRIIVLANMDASRTDLMALGVAEHFLPGVLPKHTSIRLSNEVLMSFAGTYEYPGLGTATVTIDGTALRWRLPAAGSPVRYIPESTTTLFSADDPRQLLIFTRDENNRLIAVVTNSGREIARGIKQGN